MSEKHFVHIGLGKTATTTLQRFVFKEIADSSGYTYLRARDILDYVDALENGSDISPIALHAKALVSCESLVGWNPYHWKAFADSNLKYFGADSTILLVIREPSAYLRSVYLQECVHEGRMISQSDYFKSVAPLDASLNMPQFNLEQFDYQRLIDLYRDRFATVAVQKMEHLTDLEFIDGTFKITPKMSEKIIKILENNKSNRAYSKTAVNLSFALNKLFTRSQTSRRREPTEITPFRRRFHHCMWRKVVQNVIDKILPYEKFDLNWDGISDFDRDRAGQQYKAMPKCQIFRQS